MSRLLPILAVALTAFAASACGEQSTAAGEPSGGGDADNADTHTAIFAGGCFWCVEEAFDQVDGVTETVSGYIGGEVPDPTYDQISAGGTGHYEALKVRYDPAQVDYQALLTTFWHNIDPTDADGQFCDQGPQYRSGVFVADDRQRRVAEASRQALREDDEAPSPITTEILDATTFYPAEAYHQNYYEKRPVRYNFYKNACGRKARLEELWGEQAGKP